MTLEGTSLAKPFVKWAGGKGGLLAQLQPLMPAVFNDYYEPFVGGGAVYFSLNVSGTAHINDINDDLIKTYQIIKDDVETFIKALSVLNSEYKAMNEEDKQLFYYERRAEFNTLQAGFRKSALMLFLNRTCFNGLYRENSKGDFNVPFGRYKNPNICNEANLRAISQALKTTVITNASYRSAVQDAQKEDFVYLDPPYYPLNPTSSFTAYHETGFNSADQVLLSQLYKELDARGCYVMLSNSSAAFMKDLYKDFRQETVYAGRNINAHGAKRAKVAELVVLNY